MEMIVTMLNAKIYSSLSSRTWVSKISFDRLISLSRSRPPSSTTTNQCACLSRVFHLTILYWVCLTRCPCPSSIRLCTLWANNRLVTGGQTDRPTDRPIIFTSKFCVPRRVARQTLAYLVDGRSDESKEQINDLDVFVSGQCRRRPMPD